MLAWDTENTVPELSSLFAEGCYNLQGFKKKVLIFFDILIDWPASILKVSATFFILIDITRAK